MIKLIVFSALTACVLASVVPKPPPTHIEKNESPAVKGVPLHPDHHSSSVVTHKPTEVKPAVKYGEASKHQEKSAKKDEHHEASVKKAEQPGHHEATKHEVAHDGHPKAGQEHLRVPVLSVKDADHKGHQVEGPKAKSTEHKN